MFAVHHLMFALMLSLALYLAIQATMTIGILVYSTASKNEAAMPSKWACWFASVYLGLGFGLVVLCELAVQSGAIK